MKVLGIIAEFNPMHIGHKYLIEEAKKKTGADYTILVISGNFTQIGNISIIPKFTKANISKLYGVDLVIELPIIYSISSAESFAKGAINLLNSLGIVDYVAFGAECENIITLKNIAIAELKNEQEINKAITLLKKSSANASYANMHSIALENYLSSNEQKELSKPNNILGVQYIKSLLEFKSTISPLIFKRKENVSSTTIRNSIITLDSLKSVEGIVLKECYNYITSNIATINNLYDNMFILLKYIIVSMDVTDLSKIYGISEGLECAIKDEALKCNSYDEFVANIKSKRYTMSRIKRILINILLGITKEQHDCITTTNVTYIHVLAKNGEKGRELLSKISKSKSSSVPLITKMPKEILKKSCTIYSSEIFYLLNVDIFASNIYSIISKDATLAYVDFTNKL